MIAPTAAKPPTTAAPAPRRSRRLGKIVAALLLVAVGFGGSTLARLSGARERESETPLAVEETPTVRPHDPAQKLRRMEAAIRAGRFAEARELAEHTDRDLDPGLRNYLHGLCLEATGKRDEAAQAYATAASDRDRNPRLWALASLGAVRVERNDPSARGRLAEVLLESGRRDWTDDRILAECLHLSARLEFREVEPKAKPDPFAPTTMAGAPLDGGIADYLDWLPATLAREPADCEEEPLRIERPKETPDVAFVTGHRAPAPAVDHLHELGDAAGWEVRIDPAASQALAGRRPLSVCRAPLDEILSAFTEPHRLEWRVRNRVLDVRPALPASSESRRTRTVERLRRALRLAPGHPTESAAELAVANLSFANGHVREAMAAYRTLLDEHGTSREATCASYNLGLLELRRGELRAARGRFLELLDRRAEPKWVDLAYWWIARTHLDAGEFDAAVPFLKRARNGSAPSATGAATLGLGVAHFLNGDNPAARAVLRGVRWDPDREPIAQWLNAVLLYRAAPTAGRAERVAIASRLARDGETFGPAGTLLAGRIYAEIGRHEEMIRVYDGVVETAHARLAAEMTFSVADRMSRVADVESARMRLLAVSAGDPNGYGPRAELRLAEMAAEEGLGDECIRRARAVLGRQGLDRNDVLRTLGRGYELVRDHRRAAECFAGRTPDD